MDMPQGMKHDQPDLPHRFGENADILEGKLRQINWRFFATVYFALLAPLLLTIFFFIVVIRAAFLVF